MTAQTLTARIQVKKDSLTYYLHSLICLLIMFGFGLLAPSEPLTPLGMSLIGIFLGLLYGWMFIDIVWPSLAGLLALVLVGGMQPVTMLNRSFGDPIVIMMFFIFIFCAVISHYGLSKFISLWFITRDFVAGKPWLFTFTFLASIVILGGLTSASPAAIIGWSILYGVCEVCGYKKGEAYPTMMVFGVVFAAQVGMALIPFKQAALTVLSAYESMSGVSIDYAKYMLIAVLAGAACTLIFVVVAKYIFKPDMEKLKALDVSALAGEGALTLNRAQKIVLFFLFALVALLLLPNFLPPDFFLALFLKSIGNTGICIFLVTLMCFLKIGGEPLLKFKLMVDSGVAWSVILLLAVVQPLSWAMAQPEGGITAFLIKMVDPVFGGSSPLVFTLFISFTTVALTQIMNNGAVGIAMMPILYSYSSATGAAPEIPLIMVIMSIHLALLTPAASACAALLHGNEWSDTKSIWRTAPIIVLLSWAAMLLITVLLGGILY